MALPALKKNPLGLADFRDMLRDNYAYADKTRFIEVIDDVNFLHVVRPRRFGKSMFTTMLQAYYDKAAADEFDIDFLLALKDEDSLLSHGASLVISSVGSCC